MSESINTLRSSAEDFPDVYLPAVLTSTEKTLAERVISRVTDFHGVVRIPYPSK